MGLIQPKKVLISPMAWGLGHATRIVPIIHELSKRGYSITVATSKELGALIKENCPFIDIIDFYSPQMRLKAGKTGVINLAWFLFTLPIVTILEQFKLKQLLKINDFPIIISDNRYGFRTSSNISIIITHQLRIIPPKPFGFLLKPGEKVIKYLLGKFDEVWIPDFNSNNSLAGMLSESNGLKNLRYIGYLSRFSHPSTPEPKPEWDVTVIASGPEPQKTEFIELLIAILNRTNLKCLIVKGHPLEHNRMEKVGNIFLVGNLEMESMAQAISGSKCVISRSGYSTIMDLICLGKSAILVPTPGQTEQEYLAQRMEVLGWFRVIAQNELDKELIPALKTVSNLKPPLYTSNEILRQTLIEQKIRA